MDRAAFDPSKELRLMLAFFGEAQLPRCREIPADQIPEPCHRLLVHNKHMTVTLEEHYGEPVRVRPYLVRHEGDVYARKLDLVVGPDDLVIMTGIMMFNLSFATPEVREQIIEQRLPLGRILIAHNILREISTTSFLEIAGDDPLAARFGLDPPRAAYGRLATIFCNGNPAVDLLEIVRPEPSVRHHAPPWTLRAP